ncbi:hypothetical protein V6N13_148148 [Hibiscus sabdariffa]|uniref:Secreted protein n=1 Tax=Hibiscus sabdariffa TaxID=183260 RepID=A0ABR2TYF1_9ROSI
MLMSKRMGSKPRLSILLMRIATVPRLDHGATDMQSDVVLILPPACEKLSIAPTGLDANVASNTESHDAIASAAKTTTLLIRVR